MILMNFKMGIDSIHRMGEDLIQLSLDFCNFKIGITEFNSSRNETISAMKIMIGIEDCDQDKIKMHWLMSLYIYYSNESIKYHIYKICYN